MQNSHYDVRIANRSRPSSAAARPAFLKVMASLIFSLATWSLATIAAAQSLEVVIQSGHLAEIRDVSYSPDGCYIATAGADNRVKLWDESTGREIRSFRGSNRPHSDVTFSADGRSIFIGIEGGAVTHLTDDDAVGSHTQ